MSSPETTEHVVAALRDALASRTDVSLALLFGSVARGSIRDDSDVDVALDAPTADHLALARDLSLAVGRDVHLADLRQAGYPLLAAIVRDRIVVAEHPDGSEARWRTRAILTLETDRIWFERMRDAYLAKLATSTFRTNAVGFMIAGSAPSSAMAAR